MEKERRLIMGLSGGKDSAALAVYMKTVRKVENIEYFFCDTGMELPETYEYLDRIRARLGVNIIKLAAERGFDHWLDVYGGYLPSNRARWCTKQLKIIPIEKWIGDDYATSFIGIRADENRDGYITTRPNIQPAYPFQEDGLVRKDIIALLEDSGIGLPPYMNWGRSRSGCFFCFYQRKFEWIRLAETHPDLFKKAQDYERQHKDGRTFTWCQDETLEEIYARREQIIAEYEKSQLRQKKRSPNKKLVDVLEDFLDGEDNSFGCTMCHL